MIYSEQIRRPVYMGFGGWDLPYGKSLCHSTGAYLRSLPTLLCSVAPTGVPCHRFRIVSVQGAGCMVQDAAAGH